jgi:hypothetical protein
MIAGAAQADAALLVVDGSPGGRGAVVVVVWAGGWLGGSPLDRAAWWLRSRAP